MERESGTSRGEGKEVDAMFGGLKLEETKAEGSESSLEVVITGGPWDEKDRDRLGVLSTILWDKKAEEYEEVARVREMRGEQDGKLDEYRRTDRGFMYSQEYRERWISKFGGRSSYRCFDDTTGIMPMNYTYSDGPPSARPCRTIQVYSVSVESIPWGRLLWPLHVFGMVAIRDSVCPSRNIVFYRKREDCQIITPRDPYLILTGPTRSVVAEPKHDVFVEIDLKAKGANEHEDRYLSFQIRRLWVGASSFKSVYPSPNCFLELAFEEVWNSVEATIFLRVMDGLWPDGFNGEFFAATSTIADEKVVLVDFAADKVPVSDDGYMDLFREVVSVDLDGKLKVSFKAWQDDNAIVKGEVAFKPETAGRSYGSFHLMSCKVEVLVAWSLMLNEPEEPEPEPDVATRKRRRQKDGSGRQHHDEMD